MILLTFAAYRTVRFFGWDDWPPIKNTRARLIGEHWIPDIPNLIAHGERQPLVQSEEGGVTKIPGPDNFFIDGGEIELPGKQPSSEAVAVRPAYTRPLLAHFIHCPFCLSAWTCLVGFIAWELFPHAVTWMSVPVAASGAVGLISKNWDP
jgi:hypothetical protein